ncbi:hypothetical protein INT45_007693, partial [Circinella minor]
MAPTGIATLPSLAETVSLTRDFDTTLHYLREHGIFYEEMQCRNGTIMNLNHFSRDGLMWQCPSVSCGCTPGSGRQRLSVLTGSFFARRNVPLNEVLQVLWGILHRFSNESITSFTHSSGLTIQRLIRDFHLLIEADLHHNDVQI